MRRRADLVFTRRKIAVFLDGCFWHRCPVHGTVPKNNREWWIDKLDGNVRRDRDTDHLLTQAGWRVVRAWEHEPTDDVVARVEEVLQEIGGAKTRPQI